jgi:hypothetical protein
VPAGDDRRRADGRKELIALADGSRESVESWADLLCDCARPEHARPIRPSATGRWASEAACVRSSSGPGRDGGGSTRRPMSWLRCRRSAHPGPRKAPAEIWGAEGKEHALAGVKAFEAAHWAKFPKVIAKITGDADELLAVYDYLCEYRVDLRTTDEIVKRVAVFRLVFFAASGRRGLLRRAQRRRFRPCVVACRCRRRPGSGRCLAARRARGELELAALVGGEGGPGDVAGCSLSRRVGRPSDSATIMNCSLAGHRPERSRIGRRRLRSRGVSLTGYPGQSLVESDSKNGWLMVEDELGTRICTRPALRVWESAS